MGIIATVCALLLLAQAAQAAKVDWRMLQNQALSLYGRGQYEEAILTTKQALDIASQDYGPDHPRAALSMHVLGELYYNIGDNSRAEFLYLQALKIFEKALGRDHISVALVLTNMAELYLKMNRNGDSASCLSRAQDIYSMNYRASHVQGLGK